jgi:hypothetical protein
MKPKKITKKQTEYKQKVKIKASKEQFAKFKECFDKECEGENKTKMDKAIKNFNEQKSSEN